MKLLSRFMIALIAISMTFACKNQPEGEKAKVGEAKEVAATPSAAKTFEITSGTVYWTGTKVGGQHSGTINVGKGQLSTTGGNIASGEFAIDMSSIKNTDIEDDEGKAKLVGHLSSPDFFNVGDHPYGNFKIVSVEAVSGSETATHNITGNLTLKGITKSVTIPAMVVISGNSINAVAPKFTINRTDWDIKYGSGLIGTAKDKIIHDEISLNLELTGQAS